MSVLTCRSVVRGGAAALAAAACGLGVAGAAQAAGDLGASPKAVIPGGTVTVEGHCPDPTSGEYVRATVGVDSIGRYIIVPVEDGAFSAKFRARGASGFDDPAVGDKLRARVSCATDASFVATVGTVKVKIVDDVLGAGLTESKSVAATTSPRSAAAVPAADGSVPAWIPLGAFVIAVVGSIGAYVHSRRAEQR